MNVFPHILSDGKEIPKERARRRDGDDSREFLGVKVCFIFTFCL